MVNFPTTLDDDASLYLAANLKSTTLNGAHTDSVTTITVVSTTGFPSSGWLRIEEPTSGVVEMVTYTGKTATEFTGATRGADTDFPAQAHSSGATVTLAVVAAHHNALKDGLVATQKFSNVFNRALYSTKTDWYSEGPLYFHNTGNSLYEYPGRCASENTTTAQYYGGFFGVEAAAAAASEPSAANLALTTGSVIDYVGYYMAEALPTVTTIYSGVGLFETNLVAAAAFTIATTTEERIGVGFTSEGVWHVYTSNGSAVTDTTTTGSIAAVAGTIYKIRILYTVGTDVKVYIDDVLAATVTATLPTLLSVHGFSKSTTTTSRAWHYGGAWKAKVA